MSNTKQNHDLFRQAELKISALRKKVKRTLLRESGAVAFTFDIHALEGDKGHFSAKTSLQLKTVKLFIDPSFAVKLDDEMLFKILIDLGRHEIGHWEYPRGSKCGCPFDVFHAVDIYEAVNSVLEPNQLSGFTDFIANSFMDIVVNTNIEAVLRRRGGRFTGVVLFYYDQGTFRGMFSDFYSFFVKIQEKLWMMESDRKMLESFHPKKRDIEEAVNGFISRAQLLGSLDAIVKRLNDKNEWITLSALFANYAMPFLERYKILEILIGGESPGEESEIKKWLRDPNNIAKIIVRKVNSGDSKNSFLISDTEALWVYYNQMAKSIIIRLLSEGKKEYFDAVKFGKTDAELFSRKFKINQSGDIDFVKHKFSWKLPIIVHDDLKEGIPNLYFILDVSGSMEGSNGTRILNSRIYLGSKYHYALLGVFGILKYLQAKNLLPRKIALTVFSDNSKSEIVTPNNLRALGSLLFNPEYGGTYLNIDEVKRVLDKLGTSVIILLSDGEISNWSSIAGFMISVMQANYSTFISIDSLTETFYDLKDVCEVIHVTNEQDLANIMINFAAKKYNAFRR